MHLVGAETVPYALNGQSHASDIYVEQNSRAALGVLFDKHARGMTFQLAHIFAMNVVWSNGVMKGRVDISSTIFAIALRKKAINFNRHRSTVLN